MSAFNAAPKATKVSLGGGNGWRPQRSRNSRVVAHIPALDLRDEAAWKSCTRAETAVDRAAAVESSGGEPREAARRPGAPSRSGGSAPGVGPAARAGDLERLAEAAAGKARCQPHGGTPPKTYERK